MQAASGSGGANGGRRTAPGCSEAGSPERGLAPVPLPPPVQCESSASPPTGAERPVLGRPPWTRRTTDAAALAARIARSPPFTPPTSPDDLRSAARRGRASFWSCSAIPAAPLLRGRSLGRPCRSQSACSRIQNWGDVFSSCDNRRAVSAVIRRLPSTTSLRRFAEIPNCSAASDCRSPSGLRNSSNNISPGGTAGPGQSGSLVIVFDFDLVGMAVLPPKGNAILIVDPYAVLIGPGSLQQRYIVRLTAGTRVLSTDGPQAQR